MQSQTSNFPLSSAATSSVLESQAVTSHTDDRLSGSEVVLLLAAFSTLLCSMMLSVIVP